MSIIEVFQTMDGKTVKIDKGIFEGGTFRIDGEIYLLHDSDDWDTLKKYDPKQTPGLYWTQLQDNGNGWEIVFDSREGIDRSVDYELPSWFSNPSLGVPISSHRINDDGEVEETFHGYQY